MRHSLATLVGIVRRSINAHSMIEAGDRVLVAVSGGADSACLALVLQELRDRLRFEIAIGHVHHGLRGEEADADQDAAECLAERLVVEFAAAAVNLPGGSNVEARAREARYRALHELAGRMDCNKIATGHTRDDQAETFLLRLLVGAGVEGLTAIHPTRVDGVIRPLLDCHRNVVEQTVRENGIVARRDAMNDDPRFLRTRVRHEVIPLLRELNPEIAELCARSVDSLRAAQAAQNEWAMAHLTDGEEGLDLRTLEPLSADLRRVLVWSWLRESLPDLRVTSRHVDAIVNLAQPMGVGREVHLPARMRVERAGLRLSLRRRPSEGAPFFRRLKPGQAVALNNGWVVRSMVREDGRVAMPSNLWSAVCDLERCGVLAVRPPRPGDIVRPLGLGGRRKVSEILRERRIPRSDRASYPVITSGDDVLWVPGVVRAETSVVGVKTKRVAVLHASRLAVAGGGGA